MTSPRDDDRIAHMVEAMVKCEGAKGCPRERSQRPGVNVTEAFFSLCEVRR
jgi:hypothetical protein